MFGLYSTEGGCDGEMAMRWHDLGSLGPTPRLEAFQDSWRLLPAFGDVLAWMAEHRRPTPDEFCAALLAMGFADLTERERPVASEVEAWRSGDFAQPSPPAARDAKLYDVPKPLSRDESVAVFDDDGEA